MFTIFTDTHYNFLSKRRWFYAFSIGVTLVGIISILAHGGLRMGIDFAGGRLIQLRLSEPVATEELRRLTASAGFAGAEIQSIQGSNDVLIRIPLDPKDESGPATPSERLRAEIARTRPGLTAELLREESIGAKIGREIRGQAFWAILVSLVLLLIYIGFRFEPRFGLGAVIAVAHDVFFIVSFFSVLNLEFTMPVVAALLTIAGYSINDTIVVFDRVRELQKTIKRKLEFTEVINAAVNQTLSRTIWTSLTTLIVTLALLLFGGEPVRGFAFAFAVGIVTGTYSSIFIASPVVVWMHNRQVIHREMLQQEAQKA